MLNLFSISSDLLDTIKGMSVDNTILMDLLLSLFRAYEDNKQVKRSIRDCYNLIKIETNHNELVKLSRKRRDLETFLEHLNREINRIENKIDSVIEISYSKSFKRTYEKLVDSYKYNHI